MEEIWRSKELNDIRKSIVKVSGCLVSTYSMIEAVERATTSLALENKEEVAKAIKDINAARIELNGRLEELFSAIEVMLGD